MTADSVLNAPAPSKPWYTRVWVWIVAIVLLLLIGLGVYAALLIPSALTAKSALERALPLAGTIKEQVLGGELSEARESVAELRTLANEANTATDTAVWRSTEWIPVIGDNTRAVRVVTASLEELTTGVLEPAASVGLDLLKPVDGAINVAGFEALTPVLQNAQAVTAEVTANVTEIESPNLVPQISDGLVKLQDALGQMSALFDPAAKVLGVLPGLLGAETPQNYLLIFQNNAEIRTTGGNPAALALLNVDNGKISIAQQASSRDFNNNRPEPIIPLNPETAVLYGDRVGTWMQDITFTPDFTETAALMRAFWAESFGTPVDAVVSFDPVALSYLIAATGPIELSTGDVITSENAVALLLSDVYAKYTDFYEQDAFFAEATQAIFSKLTTADLDMKALITALTKGAAEGRLIVSSSDQALMDLIGSGTMAGPLPASNDEATVLGVFLNDLTIGKMDYYLYADVTSETTQCSVPEAPTFTATINMKNVLDEATRANLPRYVTADSYGYGGAIHTDVMMYGPVGTRIESVQVDGEIVGIGERWDGEYRELTHNGRPVLQVPILLRMQTNASVTVTFAATEGQTADAFGTFETRVTPTVHETPVTVSRPQCS